VILNRPLPEGAYLTGRTALVTGSAKRLGRHLALTLARLGANVAVHYRTSEADAQEVVEAIRYAGGEAAAFQADLTDHTQCRKLVQEVVARFGELNVLVNNVGDYLETNILELSIADWHAMVNGNLNATFYMCHAALPHLREQDYARIVNLGFAGVGQSRANVNSTAYEIAKAGILTLTKSLGAALVESNLTVNMVSPGVLEESITHPPLKDVPKRRWAKPEELAGAMAYFLAPQAEYVTGQHLEVSGGWRL
jgi:NAD(P)-dependent dehydrogenase (short-subunit alcohol dehydrogenase family)